MEAPASLGWITIDCDDADAQAKFYREALGWEITFSEGPYSGISDGTITIEFNAVEGYQRPQWPDSGGAKQFHLELMVDDLDKAAAELLAAGAAQPQFQPGGDASACSPIRPVTRSASSIEPWPARTDCSDRSCPRSAGNTAIRPRADRASRRGADGRTSSADRFR